MHTCFIPSQNSTKNINIMLQEPPLILLKTFHNGFCEGIGRERKIERNKCIILITDFSLFCKVLNLPFLSPFQALAVIGHYHKQDKWNKQWEGKDLHSAMAKTLIPLFRDHGWHLHDIFSLKQQETEIWRSFPNLCYPHSSSSTMLSYNNTAVTWTYTHINKIMKRIKPARFRKATDWCLC